MIAASLRAVTDDLPSEVFTTLERRLVVRSNCPEALDYARTVYHRVRIEPPQTENETCDVGVIFADPDPNVPWLLFNGEPVKYKDPKPSTPFRLGFYGSSKLFRLSFLRNPDWYSLYGAALRVGDRAVIIAAHSGTGKTTLALELMARGARFYGDEFVFVRKSDKAVSGVPRPLLIRERTLSIIRNPRLKDLCEASAPRKTTYAGEDRVWDNIDPTDLFGEDVLAQPAPLAATLILTRGPDGAVAVEQVPAALAAVDCSRRLNTNAVGFERLTEAAALLAGTPCYRMAAGSPQSTADAIEALLR